MRRGAQVSADFSVRLLAWFEHHGRHDLPWQRDPSAYRVWVSEIMLQQTQVATVIPYFERFTANFPSLSALAEAPLDAVLHHWSGLGYYARARNLHRAANLACAVHGGELPQDIEALQALPGIGRSTAAAILSLAGGQRQVILDGNVKRVLTRHFAIEGWPGSSAVTRRLWELADSLTPAARDCAAYNQAIMDFGARHCTPRQPACSGCPMSSRCVALQSGRVAQLPVKKKTITKRMRFFAYAVFEHRNTVWLRRRDGKDIWQQLYEFPLLEQPETPADTATVPPLLVQHFFPEGAPEGLELQAVSKTYRQTLSHQIIQAVFIEFKMPDNLEVVDFQKTRLLDYTQTEQFK